MEPEMSSEEIRTALKRLVRLPEPDEPVTYLLIVAGGPTAEGPPVLYSASNITHLPVQIHLMQEYLDRKSRQRSEQAGMN